jgi:DNA-binding transcriptional regulator YiaG
MHEPTPAEIRAARKRSGLTQTSAATLIGKPLRTWQGWETAEGIDAHRKMDAALWELWQLKLTEHEKGK